jgi:metal-responsive CopG/Arc/MetJ family transcriptional regulator
MSKDQARLTVLMDAAKKQEFDELCASLGSNASEIVRELIVHYLSSEKPEPTLLARQRPDKKKQ